MAKKELTISEFREIIKEEAMKLKRRMVLEAEKKALMDELKTLNESYMEEELEEGVFGPSRGELEAERQRIEAQIDELLASVPEGIEVSATKEDILQKAAENSFRGEVWLRPASDQMQARRKKQGLPPLAILAYKDAPSRFQKAISGIMGGFKQGHSFGSGGRYE